MGAFDLPFPARVANHFVAFGIVDQSVHVQTHRVHEKCLICMNCLNFKENSNFSECKQYHPETEEKFRT